MVILPFCSTRVSMTAMAAALGKRKAPGKARSGLSQSMFVQTRQARVSIRPWSLPISSQASISVSSGRLEVALDLCMQGRLIVLHRQEVVGPGVEDGLGDARVATHGVDGHQRPVQGKPL